MAKLYTVLPMQPFRHMVDDWTTDDQLTAASALPAKTKKNQGRLQKKYTSTSWNKIWWRAINIKNFYIICTPNSMRSVLEFPAWIYENSKEIHRFYKRSKVKVCNTESLKVEHKFFPDICKSNFSYLSSKFYNWSKGYGK